MSVLALPNSGKTFVILRDIHFLTKETSGVLDLYDSKTLPETIRRRINRFSLMFTGGTGSEHILHGATRMSQ